MSQQMYEESAQNLYKHYLEAMADLQQMAISNGFTPPKTITQLIQDKKKRILVAVEKGTLYGMSAHEIELVDVVLLKDI